MRVYVDNDRAAPSLSKKARPEYEAMVKAAMNGEFDTIIAYSMSRVTRRPKELETLIELATKHGVNFVHKVPPTKSAFGDEYASRVLHHHRLALSPDAPKGSASQFLGACLRQIRKDRPDTWAVVSYADLSEGHTGVIYRATNALSVGIVGKGDLKFRDAQGHVQVTQSFAGTWEERRAEAQRRGWTEHRCEGKARFVWLLESGRQKRHLRSRLRWA